MSIPKELANKVLSNLDTAATRIEKLAKAGKLDSRLASTLVRDIDAFADRFEVSAYGADSFKRRQAKVIQSEENENHYMKTFDAPNKRHSGDGDEGWMDKNVAGVRWDSMVDNFDQDRTSTVSERNEYQVVGLTEMGEQKKQPTMHGGFKKHKASTKTWAD